jgi:hypothetical protein
MAAQRQWSTDTTAWLGAILLAFTLTCGTSKADDHYPNRPVRVVVPFAAGGPTDIVGRIIGQKLSELLGQQFFVENKLGAGQHRRRHGREIAGGRLHAAGGDGLDPRHQSRPLRQDAI